MKLISTNLFSSRCKRTQLGSEYRGDKSTTKSGRKCAFWKHRMTNLDPSIGESAENFCRNPDGDIGGPWCYVDQDVVGDEAADDKGEKGGNWESCGVKWCDDDADATGFRFEFDFTLLGITCIIHYTVMTRCNCSYIAVAQPNYTELRYVFLPNVH